MKRNSSGTSRRGFLKTALAGAAAMGLTRLSAKSYAQIVRANDDLRLVVVGCNGHGQNHIKQFLVTRGVRIVGICDVDSAVLERGVGQATMEKNTAVAKYADIRRVLENKEVDAISVAVPNHWHALMAIWACQAGKDIYLEKPTCHTIWEGRQTMDASRKYNRIVQAGTHWRSMPDVFEALEYVKAGKIGKLKVSRGFCYKRRASIGKTEGPQPIPATMNHDLWCGPVSNAPPRRTKYHYDWHWFWETGNGDIGNQGAHQLDVARWAMGKETVAPSVITVGGRFGYVDDGQTPNTVVSVHDYGDSQLIFEVRGLPSKTGATAMDQYQGVDVGNVIECEGGYITIKLNSCLAFDNAGKQIYEFKGQGMTRDKSHYENFVKAVKSRRREDQNAELAVGHVSSCLSHLSNISYQLGKQADQGVIKDAMKGNGAMAETYGRFVEHMAANGLKMDVEKVVLGVPLKVEVETQKVIGNDAANAMMRQKYRAPFIVPETV